MYVRYKIQSTRGIHSLLVFSSCNQYPATALSKTVVCARCRSLVIHPKLSMENTYIGSVRPMSNSYKIFNTQQMTLNKSMYSSTDVKKTKF